MLARVSTLLCSNLVPRTFSLFLKKGKSPGNEVDFVEFKIDDDDDDDLLLL